MPGGVAGERLAFVPAAPYADFDKKSACADLEAIVSRNRLVKHLKGASSQLASARNGPDSLRWQHGYGAFTVPKAALPDVEAYVRNQRLAHNAVDPSARLDLEP